MKQNSIYVLFAFLVFGSFLCEHVSASVIKRKGHHSSEEISSEENSGSREDKWTRKDKHKKDNFQCPKSNGVFPDTEDCSQYYTCKNGKSDIKKCNRRMHFDMFRLKCLPKFIAVCNDEETSRESTISDRRSTTPRGRRTTRETTPSHRGSTPSEKSSRETTISNRRSTTPRGRRTTRGTTPSHRRSTTPSDTFTCPEYSGDFPHPEDCAKFYNCKKYKPKVKTCPKGKLFDGVRKECREAKKVHCGSRGKSTTPEPLTTITNELTTSTQEPITTTVVPSTPEEPTREEPTPEESTSEEPTPEKPTPEESTSEEPTPEELTPEETTPEELTPEETTPEEPTPVETTPEETTTEEEPTGPPETTCDADDLDCIIKETGEMPKWFKCPVELGTFPHPSSRKLFILCIRKKPMVKKCGQDLVYSEDVKTCISPSDIALLLKSNV